MQTVTILPTDSAEEASFSIFTMNLLKRQTIPVFTILMLFLVSVPVYAQRGQRNQRPKLKPTVSGRIKGMVLVVYCILISGIKGIDF